MGRKITEYRGSAPQGSPLKQQLVPREVLERNKAGDEATRPNASATRTHQQQGAPAGEPQAAEEPGNEADTTRRVAQAASYHEN
jgi:hypothetical protein